MGHVSNTNLQFTYLLILLKEVVGRHCIASLGVVVFKMFPISSPAASSWNYMTKSLKHWKRMNFTFYFFFFFNFCKGGGQRFFAVTLLSEYKVSALKDETCGRRGLLIISMLKARPRWAESMNSITFCTVISPVKVSMTSNPKTVPGNNTDKINTEAKADCLDENFPNFTHWFETSFMREKKINLKRVS